MYMYKLLGKETAQYHNLQQSADMRSVHSCNSGYASSGPHFINLRALNISKIRVNMSISSRNIYIQTILSLHPGHNVKQQPFE
jgi:hypothetical protein